MDGGATAPSDWPERYCVWTTPLVGVGVLTAGLAPVIRSFMLCHEQFVHWHPTELMTRTATAKVDNRFIVNSPRKIPRPSPRPELARAN